MQHFIGVKILQAEPQEKDGKKGYRVAYEDGYESWSPAGEFERCYRPVHATKLETAKTMAAGLLTKAETACVKPPPVFQALSGRRYDDMVSLLRDKTMSIDEIADIFEVDPKFIETEAKKLKVAPKKKEE